MLKRAKSFFFILYIINIFFVLNLTSNAQSFSFDDIINKVEEKVKKEVNNENLEVYKKFSRKLIHSLKIENSTEDEITYLVNAISQFILIVDKKNKEAGNIKDFSQANKEMLDAERKRLENFSLKESYQIWLKNKENIKQNILFIQNHFERFFEENSVVILDIKTNEMMNKAYQESLLTSNKLDIENKTKEFVLKYLQQVFENENNLYVQRYDSLDNFGKEYAPIDEKYTQKSINEYLKDFFFTNNESILNIGSFSEIEYVSRHSIFWLLEKRNFEMRNKKNKIISLQIYFRSLLREYKNKDGLIPIHYGKDYGLERVRSSISYIKNIFSSENESNNLAFENEKKSWKDYQLIFEVWYSGIARSVKIISPEEGRFLSNNFQYWYKDLFPIIDEKLANISRPEIGYDIFEKLFDNFFIKEVDSCLLFTDDKNSETQKFILFEANLNSAKAQKHFESFSLNLKKWLEEYYESKLTSQDIKEIALKKQFGIFLGFMENVILKENNIDYKSPQGMEISKLTNSADKKLNILKLITVAKVNEDLLKDKNLTKLDLALYNYFNKAREKNPIFSYLDVDNNNRQPIWVKYCDYRINSIQENEKQAYDLVVKILLEESLKKSSK